MSQNAIGQDTVAAPASVKVVGPRTGLAARVLQVLEQHGPRSPFDKERTPFFHDVVAGDASATRAAPRMYLVSALRPEGTTDPGEVRTRIRSIRAREPDAAVFVLLDERNDEAVRAARTAGATDFLGVTAASNAAALEWRITAALERVLRPYAFTRRLTSHETPHTVQPEVNLSAPVEPTSTEVAAARAAVEAGLATLPSRKTALSRAQGLVSVDAPELRNPKSGRFDAKRIAERLGVSISRLAPAVGVSQQALSARPDSPRAQTGLTAIARVLAALDDLLAPRQVKMWLNAPHVRLGGNVPLQMILDGRAEPLARLLEGALEGIPD